MTPEEKSAKKAADEAARKEAADKKAAEKAAAKKAPVKATHRKYQHPLGSKTTVSQGDDTYVSDAKGVVELPVEFGDTTGWKVVSSSAKPSADAGDGGDEPKQD